ncbi:MAG TPA: hypothetical protein PK675_01620 [Clostridia bacterium]|nr:hypothetical protein [Clostridia bacterium]
MNSKKIIALIITLILCCSCFFCVEKAEAYSPPLWSSLSSYICLYVEIIGVGEQTKTIDDITWVQLEVNIIDSYLRDVTGDIYIPFECVDYVLSYNYGLIMLTEIKGELMCNYDYDADSIMVIPFFPIIDNKIVIPSNYYKPFTQYDDSMIIACCKELAFIDYFNQYLSQINVNLSFCDGMDLELLDDYFNLVEENCEVSHLAYEDFMMKQKIAVQTNNIIQIMSFVFSLSIMTFITIAIIYSVKKEKTKKEKPINENEKKNNYKK